MFATLSGVWVVVAMLLVLLEQVSQGFVVVVSFPYAGNASLKAWLKE